MQSKELDGLMYRDGRQAGPAAATAACLLAAALAGGGCTDAQELLGWPAGNASMGPARISIHELARRLGLTVRSMNAAAATLTRRGNTVTVYADPGGGVYVNARPVARGGVQALRGVLYVPRSAEGQIRLALRSPPSRRLARHARRPRPRKPPPDIGRVVIDPGHGGHDPGAIAVNGLHEKDVVLDVSLRAAQQLRAAGATVKMTRTTDRFVELEQRAAIANRFGADLFVSVHADSAKRRSARGYSTYVARSASTAARAAADALGERMAAARVPAHGTGRHEADYRVLVHTRCPAVLVELGFLSNYADAAQLATPAYRAKLADVLADGIVAYRTGK